MGPRFESQHDTKHLILPFLPVPLWRHSLTLSSANLLLRETSIFKSPEKNQPLITSCAKRQQIYAFYFFFFTAAALNFTDYSARGLTPSLSSLFPLNCALPRAHTNLVSALTSSHSFSRFLCRGRTHTLRPGGDALSRC